MKQFDITVGPGHFGDKAAVPFAGGTGFTVIFLQTFALGPLKEHIGGKHHQLKEEHGGRHPEKTGQYTHQAKALRGSGQKLINSVDDGGGVG